MKRVVKVLFVIILLIPFCVDAKEVVVSNGKLHGDGWGDYFQALIETDDSYIAASYSGASEINGISSLGGTDIRLFKYKKDTLEVEWQKIYGGTEWDYVYDMTKSSSNEFVIVGETNSSDITGIEKKGENDALIVKYNINGEIIWQKNYGGTAFESFSSVTTTNDGGYVVVGNTSSDINGLVKYGNSDAIIVKYDKDGNIVWQRSYGGNYSDSFSEVVSTNDGYIAVGISESTDIDGLTNIGNNDAIIVKFDLDGNVVWQNIYGGRSFDKFVSLTILDDGSIVAIGYSESTNIEGITNKGNTDSIIVKYDANGNLLWHCNYGGSGYDYLYKIKKISESRFLIVGEMNSSDIDGIVSNGRSDAVILIYDKEGNLLEQHNFGGSDLDCFNDIIPTKKGYAVVGGTWSTDLPNLPYDGGYDAAFILEYTINYELEKENDNIKNGTYELTQVDQRAEISINPDNGYELDKIVVKDLSGNELTYYEENGKYYVDLTDDIVVDVKYKQKSIFNPNTGGLLMIGEIILLLVGLYGSFYFIKKKKSLVI